MAKIVYVPIAQELSKHSNDPSVNNYQMFNRCVDAFAGLKHDACYTFGNDYIFAYPTLDEALYYYTKDCPVDVYQCETGSGNYIENTLPNGIVYYQLSMVCNATYIHNISYDCNSNKYNSGELNFGKYNKGRDNFGSNNAGRGNIGINNDGIYNLGHYNSGYNNKGNSNNGMHNQGKFNNGKSNFGFMNNGADNIGEYNSGMGNVGSYNNGSYNIGSYNIGCFNKTDHAIGFFNTEPCKEFRIFNKKLPDNFVFDYEGFVKALSGYYGYFKILGKEHVIGSDKIFDKPFEYLIAPDEIRNVDPECFKYAGDNFIHEVYVSTPRYYSMVRLLDWFLPFSKEEIRIGVSKILTTM